MRKKRSRDDDGPKAVSAKSFRTPVVMKVSTPAENAEMKKNLELKKLTIQQQLEHSKLEKVINAETKWQKVIEKNPGLLLSKIVRLFRDAGDDDSMYLCALRLMVASDKDVVREELNHWRETAAKRLREVQTSNNNVLNQVEADMTLLTQRTMLHLGPVPEGGAPKKKKTKKKARAQRAQDSDSDFFVDTGPKSGPKDSAKDSVKDSTKDSAKDSDFNNTGPKSGPKDSAKDSAKDSVKDSDFNKADVDYYGTKQIPKTSKTLEHFRKCYPNGVTQRLGGSS